ncbi:MAG: NADAR family protein [Desulfobacteraceae bacterium]|nr:NADAR family protein [Desulfobacteraceae bacterium]
MRQIRFYRTNEKYGYFSNFAPYPIKLKGREWPTSEHYFQSQKFAGHKDEEEIRLAPSPMFIGCISQTAMSVCFREFKINLCS